MGRSSETFAWVAVTVCVALLLFAWFNGMFPQDWYPEGGEITFNTWTLQVSSEPFNGGYTSISGNNSIGQFESITVYATAKAEYAFSHWIFDSQQFPTNPQITIPAQDINSYHILKAEFIPEIVQFKIYPALTLTKGTTFSVSLNLENDGDATVKDVQIKLNDHYGVFSSFRVLCNHFYFAGSYWANIINTWSQSLKGNYILFKNSPYNTPTDWELPAHSTKQFFIGGNSAVNSTIPAGTYHLSFSIRFTVTNGTFTGPPELTIPWDVTVLG